MNQQRKKLNKKILALILALSMVLGQGTGVFATESQNAAQVPAQETEAAPEAEKAAETEAQTPQAEEPAQAEAPAEETAPAEEEAAGKVGEEQPSTAAEEVQLESMDEALVEGETEENVSGNETVSGQEEVEEAAGKDDERISLSGGTIKVELSTNGMHVAAGEEGNLLNPETLDFTGAASVPLPVPTHASKYVDKDPIGVDFKVLSSNDPAEPTTLSENDSVSSNDYRVEYRYEYYNYDNEKVVQVVNKDYVPEYQGTAVINISGNGRYKNYIEFYYPYEFKPVKISAGSVEITPAQKSATVKNKEEEASVFVYAVGMSAVSGNREENEYKDFYKEGRALKPGASATIYSYSKADGTESDFSESSNYIIVISTDAMFRPAEAVYQQFMTTSAGGSSDITDALDGYTEIGFKAWVDKASQTIKLKWSPANSKGYKAFELKRLKKGSSEFEPVTGWSGKRTSKSFAYKAKDRENPNDPRPAVFMLECYKKASDTAPEARYITVAAPSLFYVETGLGQDMLEFCFSDLDVNESDGLNYNLEISTAKNFSSVEKSEKLDSAEVDSIYGYQVGKISANAATGWTIFDKMTAGTQYYQRVTAEYSYKGKKFTSAPSNVISKKAGQPRASVENINGVRYVKPTGSASNKAQIEEANAKRMNRYLSEMLAMDSDGCLPEYSTMELTDFVHTDNEGPDKSSGYVVFITPKTDNLKGFELLTSDRSYGKYKTVKLYKTDANGTPAKNSGLFLWDPSNAEKISDNTGTYDWLKEDGGYQVYYAQYNKFVPGTATYFAVRPVSKTGVKGGYDNRGYECIPELDEVRSSSAFYKNEKQVDVYWTRDDCAKYYRIFRREYVPVSGDEPGEIDLSKYTAFKPVASKKAGTLDREKPKSSQALIMDMTDDLFYGGYCRFTDKSIKDATKEYEYVIVPLINKNDNTDSYIDKAGVVCTGYEYDESEVDMPVVGNSLMENVAKLKAVNLGLKKSDKGSVRLTWSKQTGGVKGYVILRSKGAPAKGNYVHFFAKNSSYVDSTALVGTSYRYTVFPVTSNQKQWSKKDWSGDLDTQALEEAKTAAYVAGCARPLTKVKGSVRSVTNKNNSYKAALKWSAAQAPGAVYYEVQCRDMAAGSTAYGKWYIVRNPEFGTTYDDTRTLARGQVRQYRIMPCVKVKEKWVYGEQAILGRVCRPEILDLAVGGSSIKVKQTTIIKVYPVRKLQPINATFTGIICTADKTKLKIESMKYEKDHWVVKVKGLKKGTHKLNIKARGASTGIFGSDPKLSRDIKISVY